jgi:hypothetical protein
VVLVAGFLVLIILWLASLQNEPSTSLNSPAYREPEPTIEMTSKEGVIDKLESAIKAYDAATYKAKREAGEKLATAAKAVSEGCAETDQINDLYDPP